MPDRYERYKVLLEKSIFIHESELRESRPDGTVPYIGFRVKYEAKGVWATHECRWCKVAVVIESIDQDCPSCGAGKNTRRCEFCNMHSVGSKEMVEREFDHPVNGAPRFKMDVELWKCGRCGKHESSTSYYGRQYATEKFLVKHIDIVDLTQEFVDELQGALDSKYPFKMIDLEFDGESYQGWSVYACNQDGSPIQDQPIPGYHLGSQEFKSGE